MSWSRYAWPVAIAGLGGWAALVTADWRLAGGGVALAGALVLTRHWAEGAGFGRGRMMARAERARRAVVRTIQEADPARREAFEPLLAPIRLLVQDHVPGLARLAGRAEQHLRRYHADVLRGRQERHRERAARTDDEALRLIETRNADLIEVHLQNLARLDTLVQKYDAQMEQVILALEGLTTRLTTLDLANTEDLTVEIERLTQEVGWLEEEFTAVEVER